MGILQGLANRLAARRMEKQQWEAKKRKPLKVVRQPRFVEKREGYLAASDFTPGHKVILTIKYIHRPPAGMVVWRVLVFEEISDKLACNWTNLEVLRSCYGRYGYIGRRIQLFVSDTDIDGIPVYGIRLLPVIEDIPPEMEGRVPPDLMVNLRTPFSTHRRRRRIRQLLSWLAFGLGRLPAADILSRVAGCTHSSDVPLRRRSRAMCTWSCLRRLY